MDFGVEELYHALIRFCAAAGSFGAAIFSSLLISPGAIGDWICVPLSVADYCHDESSLGGMGAGGSDSKAPLLRRAPNSPPPGLLAAYSKLRCVASLLKGSDAISGTKPTGYAQD